MEKMKRPVFQKPEPDDFYLKLHREVSETILCDKKPHQRNINKAHLLMVLYVCSYIGIIFFGNNTPSLFLCYAFTGFSMMVLFINAYHDAAHGALFSKPRHNRNFMYVLELFGSNSWLWAKRHIGLHHPYPNVQHWDIDIKQSDIVRIFPDSPRLNFHKYQHLYMWLIYPLYSLNWLYIRDFRDVFSRNDNYVRRIASIPKSEVIRMILAKAFNLFYLIAIPLMILDQPWYIIFAGWLTMHISASMLGVIALISTHVDEHAEFPDVPEDGKMKATWAQHQMLVTKDFSPDSAVANFLFGGFTHHVAHHLFPGVAHTYYPLITPVIKRYAAQYDLPYQAYPFYKAVRSHFRMLKQKGNDNIFSTGEL